MIDSVFVIKKDSNDLIFYGQLSDEPVADLENVLGQVIMKAESQPAGTRKLIAIKEGKFLYGVYDLFYMILTLGSGTSKDQADRLLQQMGSQFGKKYASDINAYAGDNAPFTGFSSEIQTILTNAMSRPATPSIASKTPIQQSMPTTDNKEDISSTASEAEPEDEGKQEEMDADTVKISPAAQIPLSQRKGIITFERKNEVKDSFDLEKPLIAPAKRQAFPDGIPEYARDEILFNESFDVQKNFECELVNYSVSVITITMNISLTHIYQVEIDFTEYPKRPIVKLSEGLMKELGKPIEEISYFLRNWDERIPAHITEIVYELEKIFTRFKSEGKLSSTQEMPEYVLPELEPLKGDIAYDPNYKPKAVEIPEYDGTELTDKFTSENKPQGHPPGGPQKPAPPAQPQDKKQKHKRGQAP
jgi:hypothetical protein